MRVGSFEFRPGLWPSLAALFFFALTMYLGHWQMTRADYKRSLQARYDDMQKDGPVRLGNQVNLDELLFREIVGAGEFENGAEILIDNRIYAGRAGYFVVTPFHFDSGQYVLVNRGWVGEVDQRRDTLPQVKPVVGHVFLSGIATSPQSRYFEFSGAAPKGKLWQNLDFVRYQGQFGKPLLPLLLEQISDTRDGLVRDWPRPDTGVAMHVGYAIQWFGLAATLVVLWLVLNIKKIRKSNAA